jgi:hypothetical protein
VNLKELIVKGKGAHPNHSEGDGHGSKDRVYWCGARGLLRDVQAVDGHIQCGDNTAPTLLPLGFVCHGRGTMRTRGSDEEAPEQL